MYRKTSKGSLEIKNRSGALSMLERRLLILVDGRRSSDQIWRITKIADYEYMLAQLEKAGYITAGDLTTDYAVELTEDADSELPDEPGENYVAARAFMLTTLRTMASPMLGARIASKIKDADDAELFNLSEDWYKAIADKPANSARVDDLHAELLKMLG